jgi:hypothetical protein
LAWIMDDSMMRGGTKVKRGGFPNGDKFTRRVEAEKSPVLWRRHWGDAVFQSGLRPSSRFQISCPCGQDLRLWLE